MKKLAIVATSLILAFALSGCVTQVTKESKPSMSASDTAASTASQSSSSASSSKATINWTSAASADEAAKGAGIGGFAAPASTTIADITFTSPKYAYTEHVAQATYDASNAKLILRRAEGAHTAPVTDRDKSEFSQSWKNTYEGFEVTSYGNQQGAAAICLWNDGTKEYGVTFESNGSAKTAMDAEDIDDIVKAVKNAETQGSQPAQSSSAATNNGTVPGFNVEQFVWNNGLGEFLRYSYVQATDGKYYWAIVTRGADGKEYTSYADGAGKIIQGGVEVKPANNNTGGGTSASTNDGADFNVEQVVQQNGLGQYKRYFWVQGENGTGYWGIVTIGADGKEWTTYTDEKGNIIQGGVEVGDKVDDSQAAPIVENTDGADFNVEKVVQDNGLGQYQRYFWAQDENGQGYWGIVTKGADGNEYITYTDEKGNVIQGGK